MSNDQIFLLFLGPVLALAFGIVMFVVTGWTDAKPKDTKPTASGDR